MSDFIKWEDFSASLNDAGDSEWRDSVEEAYTIEKTGNPKNDDLLYYAEYLDAALQTDVIDKAAYEKEKAANDERIAALGDKKSTKKGAKRKKAPTPPPAPAAKEAAPANKRAGTKKPAGKTAKKSPANKGPRETVKERYEKTGNLFKKDTLGHEVFRLLKSGRYTRDTLLTEVRKKFKDAKTSSIQTIVSDCKNFQFNKHGVPITTDTTSTGKIKIVVRS